MHVDREFMISRIRKVEAHLKQSINKLNPKNDDSIEQVGKQKLDAYMKGRNVYTQAMWFQGVGATLIGLIWGKFAAFDHL